MTRKCDPNLVKKEDLIKALSKNHQQDPEYLATLGKNDLVWKAFECGLIDDTQRDASFVRRQSTMPCYLWTHVTDPIVRERIEKYVKAFSILYSRGTYLANLAALSIPTPAFEAGSLPTTYIQLPSFLQTSTEVKKCFFPERWLERKTNTDVIDPLIKDAFLANKDALDLLLPTEHVLSNCGWDNALNTMGATFLGNVQVQVLVQLRQRICKFIGKRTFQIGTLPNEVSKSILCKLRPSNGISADDYEWIDSFRTFLGITSCGKAFEDAKVDELNDLTWTLHIWLQTVFQEDGFSRLPCSPIKRKFAYLDAKIVKSLLDHKTKQRMLEITKDHQGSELQKLLGLTSKCFNKRRAKLRKDLRKRYRNDPNKKRLKKKWSRIGHSCLSSNAEVVMVSTDGVGLRINMRFKPSEPFQHSPKHIPKDAFKIGVDEGRVNLAATSDELGNIHLIKRSQFYKHQRDKKEKKWERSRMVGTVWGEALAQMSAAGGFKNANVDTWKQTLGVLGNHISVIRAEQLECKDRALKRMRRFRWKRSFLDQSWKKVLKPGIEKSRTKHIAVGFGDAKFACTGKGEQAVPTTGLNKAFRRVVKTMGMKHLVHEVTIDEYNTTKCCHCCGRTMNLLHNAEGKEILRYRLCGHCSPQTNGKRRNRDVNASKNMLKLLACELQGLPRPQHLVNPFRRRTTTSTEVNP